MAAKYAIYVGPPLERALQGYETERSARVNQIADDWLQLVDQLAPRLDEEQWMATLDGLLSTWIDDGAALRMVWADIDEQPDLGAKWGIDHQKLVSRLRALSQPELIALREVVHRYRALMSDHAPPQALRQAGARITGEG